MARNFGPEWKFQSRIIRLHQSRIYNLDYRVRTQVDKICIVDNVKNRYIVNFLLFLNKLIGRYQYIYILSPTSLRTYSHSHIPWIRIQSEIETYYFYWRTLNFVFPHTPSIIKYLLVSNLYVYNMFNAWWQLICHSRFMLIHLM